MLWAMTVVFASAGVMTFVHDRVPDMDKYPPLPDVVKKKKKQEIYI